jgi:RNA polymerase-associated protein LEO1
MDSKPYDPTLYRAGLDTPPEDEDANMKRSRMIQVRNTIRWKWVTGDDGVPVG